MNNLKQYIVEKLNLNKDINSDKQYNKGDKCLLLTFRSKPENIVSLNIIYIKENKKELEYKYLTSFIPKEDKADMYSLKENEIDKKTAQYWFFTQGPDNNIILQFIIPHNESLDMIETIIENNGTNNLNNIIGYNYSKSNLYYKLLKYDNDSFIKYTKENIELLKKYII